MNAFCTSLLSTRGGYGLAVVRIVIGLTFMAHGAQKLFGWFGGYGLAGVGQWMESIGLTPGYLMALLAGSGEFFGGLALVIGLLVRPAAAVLAVVSLVAMFSVHWANGFFITNNGYEYALALLAVNVALLIDGAGKWSLDGCLCRKP
ncbi:DoxX family protein [Pseudomonas oryzae]|uniref:Putative oxidoreductase n=1 Tax=Pseudomonas oryzae TaxID=1392877 RepID=A0A1H1S9I9_9PSED|nr:DoxX family protein [Pseudomonas oryzae]SDS44543.1 putative oxidoreductase [Pseudomonas oryzae]